MPTKNEVNAMVRTYGLFRNDYVLVADIKPLPSNGENGPVVKAQAWYRCDDSGIFDFSHYTNAVPEEMLGNPDFLSIACAGRAGESVGVIRYRLTA